MSSAQAVSEGNPESQAWYARRWLRVICGVVGVGLLLFSVPGPLTLTFLSVTSLGCLPGTACAAWAAVTVPLGGICVVLAIAGGLVGVIEAARPRRGLVIALIVLGAATALTMVSLVVAAQAASVGRAQVASAQQTADAVVAVGDTALRETLGFHPLWDDDPQGRVTGMGPDQQFEACPSSTGAGYQVRVGYQVTGLAEDQAAALAALGPLALPAGGLAAVSLIEAPDGTATWQLVTECQPLPVG